MHTYSPTFLSCIFCCVHCRLKLLFVLICGGKIEHGYGGKMHGDVVVADVCVHIVRMPVHTSYTCPCTHHTHVRAHMIRMSVHTHHTHTRSHIVRSNGRIHTYMQLLHVFHFVAENLFYVVVEQVCGAVCVYTSYTCPHTHPTHARTHILRMPVHTSYVMYVRTHRLYACPLTHRTLQRTHTHKHAYKDTFLPAYLHPHACSCRIQVHINSIKIKFIHYN